MSSMKLKSSPEFHMVCSTSTHILLYERSNFDLGFAVIGEYSDHNIQRAQSAAFDQMLAWLKGH